MIDCEPNLIEPYGHMGGDKTEPLWLIVNSFDNSHVHGGRAQLKPINNDEASAWLNNWMHAKLIDHYEARSSLIVNSLY